MSENEKHDHKQLHFISSICCQLRKTFLPLPALSDILRVACHYPSFARGFGIVQGISPSCPLFPINRRVLFIVLNLVPLPLLDPLNLSDRPIQKFHPEQPSFYSQGSGVCGDQASRIIELQIVPIVFSDAAF
jgi:hypothetical protein